MGTRQDPPISARDRERATLVLGLAFMLFVLDTACQRPAPISSDVVARIGAEEISYRRFEHYLKENLDNGELISDSDVLSQLFDQFLDGELLVRLAVEHGLLEEQVSPRQAIAFLLRSVPQPSWDESTIESYYRAHLAELERPERVRLRQILVADEPLAEQALEALSRGEDFAQVAARLSQGPKAHLGGDQGWLAIDDLPPAFSESIVRLGEGERSGLLRADYGIHIFQVVARAPAETLPLKETRDDIIQALESRWTDEQTAGFVAEGRQRYRVKIYPENFPFQYGGHYAQPTEPD